MMVGEFTEEEKQYIARVIDGANNSTAAKIKKKKEYVKDLAFRARRGERIGRDSLNKAKQALNEITFIYFIMCGSGKAVKIGKANDVASRLSELQVANHDQLKILSSFAATEEMERVLHRVLSDHRIRGEWFKCSDEVLLVAEAALDGGIELVISAIKNIHKRKLDIDVQAS